MAKTIREVKKELKNRSNKSICLPVSTEFRVRKYPVCNSACGHPDLGNPDAVKSLTATDHLLLWPALGHNMTYIYGIHIMDVYKFLKRRINRTIVMKKIVKEIGGGATLDLVLPKLSRQHFQEMVQDQYEGSSKVLKLLTMEGEKFKKQAETQREKEIEQITNTRTRKGRDRIVPVWFLIWWLNCKYVSANFSLFNSKYAVCDQIADAMQTRRTKIQQISGDLLNQVRWIHKSKEIVSTRMGLSVLDGHNRDLLAVELNIRDNMNRQRFPWLTRINQEEDGACSEPEEEKEGNHDLHKKSVIFLGEHMGQMEEAVGKEIHLLSREMTLLKKSNERLQEDVAELKRFLSSPAPFISPSPLSQRIFSDSNGSRRHFESSSPSFQRERGHNLESFTSDDSSSSFDEDGSSSEEEDGSSSDSEDSSKTMKKRKVPLIYRGKAPAPRILKSKKRRY